MIPPRCWREASPPTQPPTQTVASSNTMVRHKIHALAQASFCQTTDSDREACGPVFPSHQAFVAGMFAESEKLIAGDVCGVRYQLTVTDPPESVLRRILCAGRQSKVDD